MGKLKIEWLHSDAGRHLDAVVGSAGFEVIVGLRDARRLRASLMNLSHAAAETAGFRFVLVLVEPAMSEDRIADEWHRAVAVLRQEFLGRVSVATSRSGSWTGWPTPPNTTERSVLDMVLAREVRPQPSPGSRRGSMSHFEILRVLILLWLRGEGPVTVNAVSAKTGFSYPTVARALRRYAPCLKRHSDRSVELAYFPREEWTRLVYQADQFRNTAKFADRAGTSRSLTTYLRRLRELGDVRIAVGGVTGALHYHPQLDIVNSLQLDLSVHAPDGVFDLSFIPKLDAGLELTDRRDDPARVNVHVVRRAESCFQLGADGTNWADPLECLLDLHAARLEPQAQEFLDAIRPDRVEP